LTSAFVKIALQNKPHHFKAVLVNALFNFAMFGLKPFWSA
jgi:hypothetical protein